MTNSSKPANEKIRSSLAPGEEIIWHHMSTGETEPHTKFHEFLNKYRAKIDAFFSVFRDGQTVQYEHGDNRFNNAIITNQRIYLYNNHNELAREIGGPSIKTAMTDWDNGARVLKIKIKSISDEFTLSGTRNFKEAAQLINSTLVKKFT
jgi:hypothetical protein